ncbi:MAG TPA: preprotein translocase subunit YajC [Steroidobacteraceae bacterium]|jgi:preprotein translocase subunit YajC|nr:preprotein translocase subunit YajC [Steroidobacteraceae bacterium]
MDLFFNTAWAQDAGAAASGSAWIQLLPLVLIFVVFYFLLIRPQTKRAKEHKEMVGKLQSGDEVVTNGGLLGRIAEVGDNFISLEVADGVTIRVQKFQVSQLMPKGTIKGN